MLAALGRLMQGSPLATTLLLLSASLAGCSQDMGTPAIATPAPGAPSPPSPAAPATDEADNAGEAVVEIAVTGGITTPGAIFSDQAWCTSDDPSACDVYFSEIINVTGTMSGTMTDRGHFRTLPDGSTIAEGRQDFTGWVEGCGSGTMSFTYTGAGGAPSQTHPGDVDGSEALALVAGSTTTGFVGVVDAQLALTFHINPVTYAAAGKMTGTVTCRVQDVPALPLSREGATAIPVEAPFTTDGLIAPDQVHCGPAAPGGCELYATLWLEYTGTIQATVLDVFHLRSDDGVQAAGDRIFSGVVPGCGSGTMTLRMAGAASDPIPDPAHPGNTYVVEPPMSLVPGSTSTGLAGIVAVDVQQDFSMSPTTAGSGVLRGTIWCRDPPAVSTSHEGARAIAIRDEILTPGMVFMPDAFACHPMRAGACEIYLNQLITVRGTMNGTLVDIMHGHANADGSIAEVSVRYFTGTIAGCGTGTINLAIRGDSEPITPVLTRPGYVHIREAPMILVPGGTTSGLAHVVDAVLTIDGEMTPDVQARKGDAVIEGMIWCIGADEPDPASVDAPQPSAPGPRIAVRSVSRISSAL